MTQTPSLDSSIPRMSAEHKVESFLVDCRPLFIQNFVRLTSWIRIIGARILVNAGAFRDTTLSVNGIASWDAKECTAGMASYEKANFSSLLDAFNKAAKNASLREKQYLQTRLVGWNPAYMADHVATTG